MLQYSLYNRYEVFNPGDNVILNEKTENVPVGTQGIILKKHPNSNYYEVEFLDSNGNLLNTLSIPAGDMEHLTQPDLETRVNSFGQA